MSSPCVSTYLQNQRRGVALGTNHVAALATVYLALYTSATGPGSEGTEVTGGAYARKAITTATQLAANGNGKFRNSAVLTFTAASADWGTVTHWALMSATSAGNRWYYGTWTTPIAMSSGKTFEVAVNALNVDESTE